MCPGGPFRILSSDGIAGLATDGTETALIDLSLMGPLPAGTWVLIFLGAARVVIDEAKAGRIAAALSGLRSPRQGGDLGDAFADLDARAPKLPPIFRPRSTRASRNGDATHDHFPDTDLSPLTEARLLIVRLTTKLGWPLLSDKAFVAAFIDLPGAHCLFVRGDPRRNLERADAILPELHIAFRHAFDCAVVADAVETQMRETLRTQRAPGLLFFRDCAPLGVIEKVRDRAGYTTRITHFLSLRAA